MSKHEDHGNRIQILIQEELDDAFTVISHEQLHARLKSRLQTERDVPRRPRPIIWLIPGAATLIGIVGMIIYFTLFSPTSVKISASSIYSALEDTQGIRNVMQREISQPPPSPPSFLAEAFENYMKMRIPPSGSRADRGLSMSSQNENRNNIEILMRQQSVQSFLEKYTRKKEINNDKKDLYDLNPDESPSSRRDGCGNSLWPG